MQITKTAISFLLGATAANGKSTKLGSLLLPKTASCDLFYITRQNSERNPEHVEEQTISSERRSFPGAKYMSLWFFS